MEHRRKATIGRKTSGMILTLRLITTLHVHADVDEDEDVDVDVDVTTATLGTFINPTLHRQHRGTVIRSLMLRSVAID
jgi:hypothetical protein